VELTHRVVVASPACRGGINCWLPSSRWSAIWSVA